jgi:hypothetical protein
MHINLKVFSILPLTLILVSCNAFQLPQRSTNVPQGLIETQAEQTISAEQTLRSPTATQTPRPTREPRTPTPTITAIVTSTVTLAPTPLPTALFTDDFSTNTGWAQGSFENYSFGITNGAYFIKVEIPMATIWSAKSIELADITLQTQTEFISGPDNGYFGLMCRQQKDGFNYYVLVIGPDGSYGIGKVVNGTLQFIQEGVDISGGILKGNNTNHITGKCIGKNLTLIVNDINLLEVEDDQFNSGTIGLVAGNRGGKELSVKYHYFIASEP